jgi:lysophospholipase L1-like esterase
MPVLRPSQGICMLCILLHLHTFAVHAQTKFKIHPLGDSTTEAYELQTAWRYWLWKTFISAGCANRVEFVGSRKGTNAGTSFTDNNWDMDHDGHTSSSASQVLYGGLAHGHTGSIQVWAPLYTPDIGVIFLGTNDCRQGRTVAATIDCVKGIITELRKARSSVDILVCKLPYWNFSQYGGNKQFVDQFNTTIQGLVSLSTAQSEIKIVDLNTDYALSDQRDGIHPGESGAKKIAARIYTAASPWIATTTAGIPVRLQTGSNQFYGAISTMSLCGSGPKRYLISKSNESGTANTIYSLIGRPISSLR